MADLTMSANVGFDYNTAERIMDAKAGAAITAGMPVYMASDGTVKPCVSTQATITGLPDFLGVAGHTAASGAMVTVFGKTTRFYGVNSGLTPGQLLYVSATAGAISDTKIGTADTPFGMAVTATDFIVIK